VPSSDDDIRLAATRQSDAALDETLPTGSVPKLDLTQATSAPPAPSDEPDLKRDDTVGKYRIIERIGGGSMGVVYTAIDPALDRTVAIKLVRADRSGSTIGRQRLLREAQAMAKLSHPNVVTVFEVGTFAERVFLAMEYVEGSTLAEWLPGRTMRDILTAFTAAGHGLAAAHRAGIVHRDFKPANVLVARDGRVRVADFGLATGRETTASSETSGEFRGDLVMTQTGALLGTPVYMSPEQHRGKAADARADQFTFCVALYEALYGDLPFEGAHYAVYADNVLEGRIKPPPRKTAVPAWLRKVLVRGLAVAPADRYPSMDALLADLARDPAARRKQLALAGGVGAIVLAAMIVLARGAATDADDPCAAADQPLSNLWTPAQHAAMRAAFEHTGTGTAAALYERTANILDEHARELRGARRDACLATQVRHEQSEALLDRRIACVDRHAATLDALVSVLVDRPDLQTVLKSVAAASQLDPVGPCADRSTLLAEIPPPASAMERVRVAAIEKELDRVDALHDAGRYREANAAAIAATRDADASGYLPIRARARLSEAIALAELTQYEDAVATLRSGAEVAAAAHDDVTLARMWILLYGLVGGRLGRFEEARALETTASAAVLRAGNSAELRGHLDNARGLIALARGDYPTSGDKFLAAAKAHGEAFGATDPRVAFALLNAATALEGAGRYAEAKKVLDNASGIIVESVGSEHPDLARVAYQQGSLLDAMQEPDKALAMFDKAAAIDARVFGAQSTEMASDEVSLGVMLTEMHRAKDALPHAERAVAILEKQPVDQRLKLPIAIEDLANTYRELGRKDDAVKAYEHALSIAHEIYGAQHPQIANTLQNFALVMYQDGDPARARQLWTQALEMREATLGKDHPDVAKSLAMLANEADDRGAHAEVIAMTTRALAIFKTFPNPVVPDVLDLRGRAHLGMHHATEAVADLTQSRDGMIAASRATADIRLELADALAMNHQLDAARAEAKAALAELEAQGKDADPKLLAQTRAWIAAHR
jgi:tetratricopeptide (TPR) repeat protein/predicted Ser/Thr protein kinase